MLGVCSSSVVGGSCSHVWREKERSRIKAVQVDDPRGLVGVRRMGEAPNAPRRKLNPSTKN